MIDNDEIKLRIIKAGYAAVDKLIMVAEEDIIKPGEDDDLSADKLKNAAATKKLAIFDAFDIHNGPKKSDSKRGFAERRSK